MKLIILFAVTFSFCVAVFAQNKKQAPSSWGHYKKLETFSPVAVNGMEAFDTLRFVLTTGDTKVEHIERSIIASNTPAKEKIKKVKTTRGF